MLGLYTFFYASLHVTTYVWFDQWFDLAAVAADILKRPFIAAGFAAYLLLWPLALTSNQAAMRRLGRRWQRLHRLVYGVAGLALLHFWWHKAGKNDLSEPLLFALIVLLLMLARLPWGRSRPHRSPAQSRSRPGP